MSPKKNLLHFSKECVSVSEKPFQYNGAPAHTANAVLDMFNENFDKHVV
jgi:hypothetical protein